MATLWLSEAEKAALREQFNTINHRRKIMGLKPFKFIIVRLPRNNKKESK